ncbi:hypothetical protein C5748_18475 [Phyllobacterium phragmitis]|uniref:Uncharacterized protein n=1 Tax=Phyllobacterium phragmitis TaxID=2670329 RepID=A0A2S9INN3_9HYPH|nr:hypothetical protein [Phyllobacterium phragmitis]PRD42134.1 hypothetical protein C5748_18475 [Phyllobacterium phragmitis]
MRVLWILIAVAAATSAASAQTKTYDPETATPRERATVESAFLLVTAKECSIQRDDDTLVQKAINVAKPRLMGEGYTEGEAEEFVAQAIADKPGDKPELLGPVSCALYDGAMKKGAP